MWKPDLASRQALIFGLLVAITLACYWQVYSFGLVECDDPTYVTDNFAVTEGLGSASIKWALTSKYAANWHPLTWASLMLDTDAGRLLRSRAHIELGEDNAGVHHVGNVVLHLANVLLLFVLLLRLTGLRWPSAVVAALFAIHPLHVESVAWVAERKDVLSTLFWLLCMLAYVRWVGRPRAMTYLAMLALFVLGLMAKPMLVTLPLVLLLIDCWPLARLGAKGASPLRLVWEKLPMFAMSAVSCVLTIWAQGAGGAIQAAGNYPIGVRAANAGVACVSYLWKTLWPLNLAFYYPHPGGSLPAWQVAGAFAALAAATVVTVARRRPYLLFGWLWYLITLAPVIGFVQVGGQAMADRYTYVPLIGPFLAVTWGACDLLGVVRGAGRRRVKLAAALAATVIALLSVASWNQIGYWRNGEALFTHALAVTERNPKAHTCLGVVMQNQNRIEEAAEQYEAALKLVPDYPDALLNLGTMLASQDEFAGAARYLKRAAEVDPWSLEARNNLGAVYARQGKLDMAIRQFREALEIDPNSAAARENLRDAIRIKSGASR